ncbi:hypothetical protein BKA66DRAFT_573903 [Pyrenochaeta sp. MPI-SDFR-AT-0127]|nr:hypothetical protein BKA66DRAFT_573903 [Pyrenochaeta sp. MPI-SDFR-AT-0127]
MTDDSKSPPRADDGSDKGEQGLHDAITGYLRSQVKKPIWTRPDGKTTLNAHSNTPVQHNGKRPVLYCPAPKSKPLDSATQALRGPHTTELPGYQAYQAVMKDDSKLAPPLNPRRKFLRNLPNHDFALPQDDPINATMVEIVVLFPNWFRNSYFTNRFQNNGINAGVHIAILEEYRVLNLVTLHETQQAREHISDQYRKTMRESNAKWTKSTHRKPEGWNVHLIQVNDFIPDIARLPGYICSPSIQFKSLASGLKKLPEGHDAGDLTRALDYAMQNDYTNEHGQVVDFMFPDDLQLILDKVGHVNVTVEHSDPNIIARYANRHRREAIVRQKRDQEALNVTAILPAVQQTKKPKKSQESQNTQYASAPLDAPSVLNLPTLGSDSSVVSPIGIGVYDATLAIPEPWTVQESVQKKGDGVEVLEPNTHSAPQPSRTIAQEAAAAVASRINAEHASTLQDSLSKPTFADLPEIPDICRLPDLETTTTEAQTLGPELDYTQVTMEDMERFFAPFFSEETLDLLALSNSFDLDTTTLPDQDPLALSNPFDLGITTHPDQDPFATQDFSSADFGLQDFGTADFGLTDFGSIDFGSADFGSATSSTYPLTQLLRHCIKGCDKNDKSDLARAARWAQQPEQADYGFMVADVAFIIGLLDTEETVAPAMNGTE